MVASDYSQFINKNHTFSSVMTIPCMTTTSTTVTDVVNNRICDWVSNHANEIEDIIADAKAKEERNKIKIRQARNKHYRSLVKHVKFSGDACVIYWNDGTQTVSRWDHTEDFDPEKAILAAMAKKLYGGTSIYCEVLRKYAEDGWDHWEQSGDELDYKWRYEV